MLACTFEKTQRTALQSLEYYFYNSRANSRNSLLCKVNKCNLQLGEKYAGSKTIFALVFQLWVCLQMSNVNFGIVDTQKPVWKFSFSLGLVSRLFASLYRPSENKEHHSEFFHRSQSPNCLMCCGSFF